MQNAQRPLPVDPDRRDGEESPQTPGDDSDDLTDSPPHEDTDVEGSDGSGGGSRRDGERSADDGVEDRPRTERSDRGDIESP